MPARPIAAGAAEQQLKLAKEVLAETIGERLESRELLGALQRSVTQPIGICPAGALTALLGAMMRDRSQAGGPSHVIPLGASR